jgi:hypothetical protein
MMYDTPEERGCQPPNGIVIDNSKAVIDRGLTPSELKNIVQEAAGQKITTSVTKVIEACNQSSETPAKRKSIEESKKLIESFKEKLGAYPKYLTYEGSVVLCVMVSINEGEGINISGLPQVDRDLIISQLPPNAIAQIAKHEASLNVEFDEIKDFILTYKSDGAPVKLHFFNAVIHPQKLPDTNVPVEQDGGKVMVGSAVVLDQKRIQKLIGVAPQEKPKDEEEYTPRRQAVAGRNAYEIRADVLQMAFDWAADQGNKYTTPDDILNVAKKFYEFVEDRRRR